MTIVTKHAFERCKERVGLPKRAILRMVESAYVKGKSHSDFHGSFGRYLDSIYLKERNANNLKIWNYNVFLFHNDVLITVFDIPSKFRSASR